MSAGLGGIDWDKVQKALQNWVAAGTGIDPTHIVWEGQIRAPRPTLPGISLSVGNIALVGWDWLDTQDKVLVVIPTIITAVNTSNGNLTVASHTSVTGDGPVRLTTNDTLPGNTGLTTDYWLIVIDATTVRLATSFQRAMAGTALVPTTGGLGINTIVGTSTTVRQGQELQFVARGLRKARLVIQAFTDAGIGLAMPQAVLATLESRSGLPSMDAILAIGKVAVTDFGNIRVHHGQYNVAYFEPRAVMEVSLSLASEVYDDATIIERAVVTDLVDNTVSTVPE